jgi:hypothetical protein
VTCAFVAEKKGRNDSIAADEEKEERIVGLLSFAVRLAFVMNSR